MTRTLILAAAAAFIVALSAPGPAQARMANPGLNSATPTVTQEAQYYNRHYNRRHHRRAYRHRAYRSYGYYPRRYRSCWNERVRIRTPAGYFVWRTHRRCGWR